MERLDVTRIFEGARLVVLGGTGFLGKVFWSMLLDRYPGIGRIYLVVRPKNVRTETEEVITAGVWAPPPGYYNFWPYWNMAYADFYPTSSYTKENIVVRVEVNLYSTKDEKLVWSGETDTVYSKDFEKLGKSYAKAIVGQLKRDNVISKK